MINNAVREQDDYESNKTPQKDEKITLQVTPMFSSL